MTNAAELFVRAASRFPDRPALWVDGRTWSYRSLLARARRLAARLREVEGTVCATLGERSLTAYCAPLACMLAGRIHVPLGANFPPARMAGILQRTRPSVLICDTGGEAMLDEVLDALGFEVTVIRPESGPVDEDVPGADPELELPPPGDPGAVATSGLGVPDEAIAYVLFTSGSTGQPKGVAVGHSALCAYVEATLAHYPEIDQHQRCTQLFESTFDLSMHDMFVTWAAGACLYCVPRQALLMPTDFVNEHALTVWFSVPSLVATLQRYRLLGQGVFPTLVLALFCGEALPGPLASAFAAAAPGARCENLYGPTEATIACTAHPVGAVDHGNSVVPIGKALPGMEATVVTPEGTPCPAGEIGELWLGGRQLAFGYWQDPPQTQARFVEATLPGHQAGRWYRTGDLARADGEGNLHFHGRADRQVKLRGYRVELQEIEAQLREICSQPGHPAEVAVVVLPAAGDQAPTAVAAFLVCEDFQKAAAVATMKARLPAYMIPGAIHVLDKLPLNSNGKVDYPALAARLDAPAAGRRAHVGAGAADGQATREKA
ncbi:MAG: amino acid adenylation domain-containing protein [Luteimonas sp.]